MAMWAFAVLRHVMTSWWKIKMKWSMCLHWAFGWATNNRNVQFKYSAQIHVQRDVSTRLCAFVHRIFTDRVSVCLHYCNFHQRSCIFFHLHKYTIFSHLEWTANIEIMHQINWINFSTLFGRTDRQKIWKCFFVFFFSLYFNPFVPYVYPCANLSCQRPTQQPKATFRITMMLMHIDIDHTDFVLFSHFFY